MYFTYHFNVVTNVVVESQFCTEILLGHAMERTTPRGRRGRCRTDQ